MQQPWEAIRCRSESSASHKAGFPRAARYRVRASALPRAERVSSASVNKTGSLSWILAVFRVSFRTTERIVPSGIIISEVLAANKTANKPANNMDPPSIGGGRDRGRDRDRGHNNGRGRGRDHSH